jgi:hypothetical protein
MICVKERLEAKYRTAWSVIGTLVKAVTLFQLLMQVLFWAVSESSREDLDNRVVPSNIRQDIFDASKSLKPFSIVAMLH